jgi:hypothetical protein
MRMRHSPARLTGSSLRSARRPARDQHLFEPVEVDERPHRGVLEEALPALVDARQLADRQAPREDPVDAGRHHDVARLEIFRPLHELEAAALGHRAFDDATGPRTLHDRVDAAVVVRDEQHAGCMGARQEDLADHSARRKDRRPFDDPVALPPVDRDRPGEPRGVAADDRRRLQVAGQALPELEQLPEAGVLLLDLLRAGRCASRASRSVRRASRARPAAGRSPPRRARPRPRRP